MADSLTATDSVEVPREVSESGIEAPDEPTPDGAESAPTAPVELEPTEAMDAPNAEAEEPQDVPPAKPAESKMSGGPDVAEPAAEKAPHPLASIKADAKSRALRSLAQGAVVAVLTQVVLVVYPLAQQLQLSKPMHVDWQAEGLIVGAAALNALVAYLHKALAIGEK